MKKFATVSAFLTISVTVIAGLVGPGVAVAATTATTTTNGNIAVSVDHWPPSAGQQVTVTGTATWNNIANKTEYRCSQWSVTFDGMTASGDASSATTTSKSTTFSHVFTAPADAATRSNRAQAVCTVQNQLAYGLIDIDPILVAEMSTTPAGSGGGSLANTGGPSVWYLVVGLALLTTGGGILIQRRRGQLA